MTFNLKKYLALVSNANIDDTADAILNEKGDASGLTTYLNETYHLGGDVIKSHLTPEEFICLVSSVSGQAISLIADYDAKGKSKEEAHLIVTNQLMFLLENRKFMKEFVAAVIGVITGITLTEGWQVADTTDGFDVQLPPL